MVRRIALALVVWIVSGTVAVSSPVCRRVAGDQPVHQEAVSAALAVSDGVAAVAAVCAGARFEHLTITAAFGEWQSMTREITYVEAMMELGTQLDNVTTIANSEVEARGAASRMMSRMKEKHHAAERAAEKARYSMRDRFQEVAREREQARADAKRARDTLAEQRGQHAAAKAELRNAQERLAKERERQQKTQTAAQRAQHREHVDPERVKSLGTGKGCIMDCMMVTPWL